MENFTKLMLLGWTAERCVPD